MQKGSELTGFTGVRSMLGEYDMEVRDFLQISVGGGPISASKIYGSARVGTAECVASLDTVPHSRVKYVWNVDLQLESMMELPVIQKTASVCRLCCCC